MARNQFSGIFPKIPLNILSDRQARNIDYRAHLDGAFARHGNPFRHSECLVEIFGFDQEVTS